MLLNFNNLLNILILSELIWVILYVYATVLSTVYDSIFIFLVGLFLLGVATCESAVGLALLILRMGIFGSVTNYDVGNANNYFIYKNKKLSFINSKIKK